MVGGSGGSVEAAQLCHELVWIRIVVFDAFDGVVELGAALVGDGEPHGSVAEEEALAQEAEFDVPVNGGSKV